MAKNNNVESPIYIGQNNSIDLACGLQSYVYTLNTQCLPAIKDLGLDTTDVKQMIRFCSPGGRERMRKAFVADMPKGGAMERVANKQFSAVMSNHPEFYEIANKWKWAKLLDIAEDGSFTQNKKAVFEYESVWLKSETAIAYYHKLQEIARLMNEVMPYAQLKAYNYFRALFYFNDKESRWNVNPLYLSESFVKKMLSQPIPWNEEQKAREAANKIAAEKQREADIQTMMEFGISEEDAINHCE